MNLFYSEPITEGLDSGVADFGVICPGDKENDIKVYIKMTGHGTINLEKAELIEEIIELEETKPEENKTEEAKKEEEKKAKRKKYKRTNLEISKILKGLKEEEIKMYVNEEKRMSGEDRIAKETLDKRNEVESYVYESRSKLDSSFKEYATPEQLQKIHNFLTETESWVYGEGADTIKSVYIERLDKMKELVEPITKRFNVYTSYPQLISDLQDALI